jgi:hypothetical protein
MTTLRATVKPLMGVLIGLAAGAALYLWQWTLLDVVLE